MTREQILSATDDELNRMAAERFMRWTKHDWIKTVCRKCDLIMPVEQQHKFIYCDTDEDFSPSTNIADAFILLEKVREHFSNITLSGDNGWGLSVWNIHADRIGPIHSDTPALAITRTALLAVMEE